MMDLDIQYLGSAYVPTESQQVVSLLLPGYCISRPITFIWAAKHRHDPNFLSRVITGDESWLYDYDPETKQQSSQWKTPSSQQHQVNAGNFFTFEELCTRCLFHLVRPSMGSFTARFWDDEGKMWGANGLRCGRTETRCCTTTMRLHTPRSLWGNSWQKITWPLFPTMPTHLTWPPAISMCSLKWKSGWMGGVSFPLKRSKQNRNRY